MGRIFTDYVTQYKGNRAFAVTERETSVIYGVNITVTLCEYDGETEHRTVAQILLEKDGLCYECEGIERSRWDFFPVTIEGKPYILFSKTLYGFTLLDPDTLTKAYEFFPEKVCRGEESFIITHAQDFGKYLIFDGCYWACPYEFSAFDPAGGLFVSLTESYSVFAGNHTATVQGDTLILIGEDHDGNPAEAMLSESAIDRLMTDRGIVDF